MQSKTTTTTTRSNGGPHEMTTTTYEDDAPDCCNHNPIDHILTSAIAGALASLITSFAVLTWMGHLVAQMANR